MEDKYRKLLTAAKDKNSQESTIFATSWIYKDLADLEISITQEFVEEKIATPDESVPATEAPHKVTEKAVILDSLNLFGEEKTKDGEAFQFEGGSLGRKKKSSVQIKHEIDENYISINDILKNRFGDFLSDKYKNKSEEVKIFFVTDESVKEEGSDLKDNDLSFYFNQEVSILFSNMIKAMKLTQNDYYISSLVFNDEDQKQILLHEISTINPELIITLGAKATNFILQSNMRLKDCHGQLQEVEIGEKQFTVMPLFSPSLLHTAPNMKKMAWADMQKAMSHLNI